MWSFPFCSDCGWSNKEKTGRRITLELSALYISFL
jgi:hypothetical protein